MKPSSAVDKLFFLFLFLLFLFGCTSEQSEVSTTILKTTTQPQTTQQTTQSIQTTAVSTTQFSYTHEQPQDIYQESPSIPEFMIEDNGPKIISHLECFADSRAIKFRLTNRDKQPWSLTHQFAMNNRDYKALKINLNGRTLDVQKDCMGATELSSGAFILCEKIFPLSEWNLWGVRTNQRTFTGDKQYNRMTALALGYRQEVVFDCI